MTDLGELDLSGITPAQERQILDRLLRDDFDAWVEQAARVGHCAHPIRLTGQQQTIDTTTGSVLSTFASASLPDEVLYVRCNNRRASWCPSCSRTYQGDMWRRPRTARMRPLPVLRTSVRLPANRSRSSVRPNMGGLTVNDVCYT